MFPRTMVLRITWNILKHSTPMSLYVGPQTRLRAVCSPHFEGDCLRMVRNTPPELNRQLCGSSKDVLGSVYVHTKVEDACNVLDDHPAERS